MDRFFINIKTGKIHNAISPCSRAKKMAESNKKYFSTYSEAENYYEGSDKQGTVCNVCFKDKQQAINFEQQIADNNAQSC